jgi:hypothetical protein
MLDPKEDESSRLKSHPEHQGSREMWPEEAQRESEQVEEGDA